MSITHESVVSMLVETLEAVDGAGSDLDIGDHFGEWLEVRGNLDLHHLASDIMLLVDQAKAEALREAANEADMWSMAGAYFPEWEKRAEWLRARATTIEGKSE